MEYTANDIQTLDFRDAVRERVAMYMGSADNQGVLQCVRELITNSIDEMTEKAKHAVASLYDLPPERERALENIVDEEERSLWFTMYMGEPCYTVCLALVDKEDDDVLPNGIVYTEKEGNYWVLVNVQTGVIEEVSYSAGIGGNG